MKKNNNALKIAFVLDDGLDSIDGVQQYILTLGKTYKASGHEVHYLVGETSRKDIQNVHSLAKNIKVRFNGNSLSIPLPAKKQKITDLLNSEQFDVIHVQMPYSPFFGAKVVKLAPKNTVIVGTFHILPYGFTAKLGTKLLGTYLRKNLKHFDKYFAVSAAAKEFSKTAFKIDAAISPNVVELDSFKPRQPHKNSTYILQLLFLGRLVERKGCSYLLDALGVVRQQSPDLRFQLTVCGKGELMDQLKIKAKSLGLADRTTFKGFVSEKEKIMLMQSADLAIFPSYAGESFGIVLIEAMAAEAGVVLGGDNPGYRSVLGSMPNTLLSVRDKEKFAAELEKVMNDPALRSDMHERQKLFVRQFDVKLVADNLLKEYSKLQKAKD